MTPATRPSPEGDVDSIGGRHLEVIDVSKRFGGILALEGVSFQTQPGEILGVIGPNGSGKTTLFNVISGFLPPSRGDVRLNGTSIVGVPPQRRARLGLVRTFQERELFNRLTVAETLHLVATYGSKRHGTYRDASDILKQVGLPASCLAWQSQFLSWGQARLLGLGMAMALDADFVLLDEPFAGVSRALSDRIQSIIRELRDEGRCVLIVEHELPFLVPICDRLLVLVNGRLIATGSPQEILSDDEVRRAYLGAAT